MADEKMPCEVWLRSGVFGMWSGKDPKNGAIRYIRADTLPGVEEIADMLKMPREIWASPAYLGRNDAGMWALESIPASIRYIRADTLPGVEEIADMLKEHHDIHDDGGCALFVTSAAKAIHKLIHGAGDD